MTHPAAAPAPKPTPEQEAVCATELRPGQLMVIRAYAGSGKSSTGRFYARSRPQQRIRYLCYNRELAQEAQASFPANCDCRTMHSLAYSSHGAVFNAVPEKLGNLRPKDVMERLELPSPLLAVLVIETIAAFLCSLDPEITEKHAPTRPGLRLPGGRLVDLSRRAWACMQDPHDPLRMPHDGYLKLWANAKTIDEGFDLLFVDEAQDLNPITADYASRMREARACGVIMVGDSHQSIYSFRLAVNAIEDAERIADYRRSLTMCFRFGQEIADRASRVLNRLKGDPVRLIGAGQHAPGLGRVILGRTNAGLLARAAMELLAQPGLTISFAGTTDRENWSPEKPYRFQEVRDLYALLRGRHSEVKTPYFRKFQGWAEVEEFVNQAGDIELGAIYRLVDEHRDGIPLLLDGLVEASVGPKEADLALSTAHRSKGREWDTAELLGDFRPVWEPKEQKVARMSLAARRRFEEEANLLYVAMTRPRRGLTLPEGLRLWLDSDAPPIEPSFAERDPPRPAQDRKRAGYVTVRSLADLRPSRRN